MISFEIKSRMKNGRGRAGVITTPHGPIETPAFIPVATKATIKSLTPEAVRDMVGANAVLANTYHLYLQPGIDILEKSGGLGKFMNWQGPTFTDSGGFQAFSLGGNSSNRKSKIAGKETYSESNNLSDDQELLMAKVTDDGVTFKSIINGTSHHFTPERSIEIQHAIGADIIFAFDECILPSESIERQRQAVKRTTEWAERCLEYHKGKGCNSGKQSLFGIVQGGRHEELRKLSAKEIGQMDFEGFGIGGSFDKDDIGTAVGWVTDCLPESKPRHLLGIGSEPTDLILGIENGIDTFDCVAPARMARNGTAYISARSPLGRINLFNAQYISDLAPIDSSCGCYTCKNYSRAYVAHLFRSKEMLAATLLSVHNLYFVVHLVKIARQAVVDGRWDEFRREWI